MKANELEQIRKQFHEREYVALINAADPTLFPKLKKQAECGRGGIEINELSEEVQNAFRALGYRIEKAIEFKDTKNLFGYKSLKKFDKSGHFILFV